MKLAKIFTDSLVLQANKPIRVFGEAEGSVKIELGDGAVSINSAMCEAKNGSFLCELSAMPYGGPYTLTVSDEAESVTLADVMVGEVILVTGQSNAKLHMSEEITPKSDYCDDDLLRIFVPDGIGDYERLCGGWTKARVDNIDYWSAVGYLVGRRARREGIPTVGVVACSHGASIIQSWIDEKLLHASELNLPDELCYHNKIQNNLYEWDKHGLLYHLMLEPLIPFTFGNVIWYQGESNTSPHEGLVYHRLLAMLVEDWRARFMNYMPFTIVQIADFGKHEGWRILQKSQLEAEKLIHGAKTVICADISENDNIHPATKWKLADRIFDSMRERGTI